MTDVAMEAMLRLFRERNAELEADLARGTEERNAAFRQRDLEVLKQKPLLDGYDRLNAELTEARAETARLREALEKYTTCWHCGDALLEEDPYHCEACPAWDCCDEGDCDAPGCIERTSDPEPTT